MAVDCHTSPSLLQIKIKMSKTDQYKYRTFVYTATAHNELCLVATVLSYLVHHPSREGPLVQFSDDSLLMGAKFVSEFHKALSSARVQSLGRQIHWTLISDWCSHDCSGNRDSRQHDKNHRSVDQQGIPGLHPPPEGTTGLSYSPVGNVSVYV